MKFSLRLNAVLKLLLSVANVLIPFFVGPYIIRTLSRPSYDLFAKASAEIQLFLALATGAVHVYGVRTISRIRKEKEKVALFFSELFAIGLLLNLLFLGMYVFYARIINRYRDAVHYVLALQFLGSAIQVEWLNEAEENFLFITAKSFAVKAIYLVSIFLLVKGDNPALYGLLASLAYILENLVSFFFLFRKNGMRLKGFRPLRHFQKLSLAFLMTGISLLYVQTDKIMLALLAGEAAVAAYTIPNYIATSVYGIVLSIFVVAIPRLTSLLHERKFEQHRKLYNELVQAFLLVFIPLLVFIFLYAEEVMGLYAAGKYSDSILPLRLFTIQIFLNSLAYLQKEGVLYPAEKERAIIVFNLIGGLFNLLANFLLFFLGRLNPATAVATLIVSYLLVTVSFRIYIGRIARGLGLLNFRSLTYFLFSLSSVPVKRLVSRLPLPGLASLTLAFALFILLYFALLFLAKDRVFLGNLRTSVRKAKEFLLRNKE